MSTIASTPTPTRRLRWGPIAATALASLLVSASGAAASQDFRSPDARAGAVTATQDLRSPDAQSAARALTQPVAQDLRSPDAREAGRFVPGRFVAIPLQHPQPSSGSSDWAYLAVGGLLSLMIGASVLLVLRRRSRVMPLGS